MVSIVERNSYLSKLRSSTKFELLFSMIYSVPTKNDFEPIADVDKIYKNVILAITKNDKNKFIEWYRKISVRQPNEYSPFANDNLLLFVLIVGVLKFNQNSDWIKNVLEIRKNTDDEKSLITTTFKNIITSNFKSSDNLFQVIFVIQELIGEELIYWSEKKELYKRLATSDFPLYKSELLNITSIKAFDSIILEADKSDDSHQAFLSRFEKRFCSRAKRIGQILHWVSIVGIYGYTIYSYFFNIEFQNSIKPHLAFFNAIGGGGLFVMVFFGKRIANFYEHIIRTFWGYNK